MDSLGREDTRQFQLIGREIVDALKRNATASEELIRLATEERDVRQEPGPPQCPNCGKINPTVTITVGEAGGPMASFVAKFNCQECGQSFFAAVIEWATFAHVSDTEAFLEGRAGNA